MRFNQTLETQYAVNGNTKSKDTIKIEKNRKNKSQEDGFYIKKLKGAYKPKKKQIKKKEVKSILLTTTEFDDEMCNKATVARPGIG